MKGTTRTWAAALAILLTTAIPSIAQFGVDVVSDPADVKSHYSDLDHFLNAWKMIQDGSDLERTLKREYLDKASPGLRNYLEDVGLGLPDYVGRFEKYRPSFATLPDLPSLLVSQEQVIRDTLQKMKSLFPNPVFLPIYYIVGVTGGLHAEPSEVGIRLAFSRAPDPDHLNNLRLTVLHELIHVQQFVAIGPDEYHSIYEDKQSLLAVSVREGVAEYLTHLLTGEYSKKDVYTYIKKDEKAIWEHFQGDMNNREFGDWLFSPPSDPDQPRDLGYIMGALIVEAYYANAEDKKKAIIEILGVTDYKGFLEKSRYSEKFSDKSKRTRGVL